MKAPTSRTVVEWRKLHPGAKALLLMPVNKDKPNSTFILRAKEEAPKGRFKCLGILD